jgi:enoyl-CoA hydratase/carnithine racemase
MHAAIETLRHGRVHELRLARPPVNALDPALCRDIVAAVTEAVDAGAEGLVLSGGPGVFSAGLDVPHLVRLEGRAAVRAAWGDFFAAARALAGAPVPVVAAIDGHAPAGGCVLALCCDWRVMAAGPFRIGLNETQVGLVAPDGIQHLLRRAVGVARAGTMLVTGALVESSEALAIGLVDALAPPGEVVAAARTWLEPVLDLPRAAMLGTRAIARADLVAALSDARIDLDACVDAWDEPGTQAALRALVARLGK